MLSGCTDYIPAILHTLKGDDREPEFIFQRRLVPARSFYIADSAHGLTKEHDFACHLARGIEYLHSKHLVHAEVSLDSILIDVSYIK